MPCPVIAIHDYLLVFCIFRAKPSLVGPQTAHQQRQQVQREIKKNRVQPPNPFMSATLIVVDLRNDNAIESCGPNQTKINLHLNPGFVAPRPD
ncbi:unnamed protein product [Fusarium graminearum]|uniref:Chromosome 4, complete genome n=2 Tax=Gibberella zeae TaxID=5518 RepID=A0A098DR19_GIBZE|nr:unnamed protein product [Fusarium graminearum]CAF3477398.1 unnamed protein product [Fusarium graminearum]CAG1974553.1 unnamed protein product [Fusarium graminearum]CAG1978372.1 unnamed protein product [Fusarium graminearum]CEF84305.1 unnamed protein product [Fusarium graminearum]